MHSQAAKDVTDSIALGHHDLAGLHGPAASAELPPLSESERKKYDGVFYTVRLMLVHDRSDCARSLPQAQMCAYE